VTLEEIKALLLPFVADREFVREILVVEAERRERDEDGDPSYCRFSGNLRGAADLVDFAYEKMVPAIDWLVAEVERLRAELAEIKALRPPTTDSTMTNDDEPWSWCPQCGPGVVCDEDDCCVCCGSTATGPGADEALRMLAELAELKALHV